MNISRGFGSSQVVDVGPDHLLLERLARHAGEGTAIIIFVSIIFHLDCIDCVKERVMARGDDIDVVIVVVEITIDDGDVCEPTNFDASIGLRLRMVDAAIAVAVSALAAGSCAGGTSTIACALATAATMRSSMAGYPKSFVVHHLQDGAERAGAARAAGASGAETLFVVVIIVGDGIGVGMGSCGGDVARHGCW